MINYDTPWIEILDGISKFRPGFKNEITGADEKDIESLENILGSALPHEYREFLQLMGRGLGELEIATCDFDIRSILEMYSISNWKPPKNLLFIGEQQNDETAYDICLLVDASKSRRVVRTTFISSPKNELECSVSEQYDESLSLQALIYSFSFYQFHLTESYSPHMFVRDKEVIVPRGILEIEEVFFDLGFTKNKLFDDWNHFYESESSVLAYFRPSGEGVQFLLSTNDIQLFNTFVKRVKVQLGMRYIGNL